MIYFRPVGGLCNRMRSLDSMIRIAKVHQRDITVLWVMDTSLNSTFEELFEIPDLTSIDFKVINVPSGFPESFLPFSHKTNLYQTANFLKSLDIFRNGYNYLQGRGINSHQKKIIKAIGAIPDNGIILNEELSEYYPDSRIETELTVREMDEKFIPVAQSIVEGLFSCSSKNLYVSSCYRVFPLVDRYNYFKPRREDLKRIRETTSAYKNTLGLHIRRTDHVYSKSISTTEKFESLLKRYLHDYPDSNFFLSTDDGDTKEYLINRFGSKILSNEIRSYDRNNSLAARDAVVDLYCLAKTKQIFGSHHSSFSQTAADIGGIIETTVK